MGSLQLSTITGPSGRTGKPTSNKIPSYLTCSFVGSPKLTVEVGIKFPAEKKKEPTAGVMNPRNLQQDPLNRPLNLGI